MVCAGLTAAPQCLPVLVVVGPTASGKSSIAMELAQELRADIVSVDSMQVYRGMDIGTAKASPEEQAQVRHHLIDLVAPDQGFSAGRYVELADSAVRDAAQRGRRALLVGGTGLYLRALLWGLADLPRSQELREQLRAEEKAEPGAGYLELCQVDPEAAKRLHPTDWVRVERALEVHRLTGRSLTEHHRAQAPQARYRAQGVYLNPDMDELGRRIEVRSREMWREGLLEEVRRLLDQGYGHCPPLDAIGYRQARARLEGMATEDEALAAQIKATRAYARRQRTWFRKERWLRPCAPTEALQILRQQAEHLDDSLPSG